MRIHKTLLFFFSLSIAVFVGVPRLLHGEGNGSATNSRDFARQHGLMSMLEFQMQNGPPVGSIVAFAGTWDATAEKKTGWMVCDGRNVKTNEFPELAARLDITTDEFQLPHIQGRTIIGAGQGEGLTMRSLLESGGEEAHTLTAKEMPSHTHKIDDPGHSHTLKSGSFRAGDLGQDRDPVRNFDNADAPISKAKTGITVEPSGGGKPHNNMPPFVVLNFLVKASPVPLGD